jgi:hypothetical protein
MNFMNGGRMWEAGFGEKIRALFWILLICWSFDGKSFTLKTFSSGRSSDLSYPRFGFAFQTCSTSARISLRVLTTHFIYRHVILNNII